MSNKNTKPSIDIEKINHNGTEAPLDIEFGLINSRAMDNVVIKEVKTAKGVDMFNLISMYGNIFVDNSHFDLTKTYLLKMGDLKTPDLKFRIFGDNPKYDKGPDIIAFFAPKVNHKMYANISFEDNEKPGRQDYIPLIAKGSYKKMFNQYTVVQEIYALHLAYEERIEDVDDESYNKFDYRKLDNSKSFYVEPNADIYSDGETVNLDDVDIPVAIEFDSVNGELKPIGTHLKPMVAED